MLSPAKEGETADASHAVGKGVLDEPVLAKTWQKVEIHKA